LAPIIPYCSLWWRTRTRHRHFSLKLPIHSLCVISDLIPQRRLHGPAAGTNSGLQIAFELTEDVSRVVSMPSFLLRLVALLQSEGSVEVVVSFILLVQRLLMKLQSIQRNREIILRWCGKWCLEVVADVMLDPWFV
jgi:hypothetical protein